jgi:triosephosphate isomerase
MELVTYITEDNNLVNGILNKSQDNGICVIMCHGIRADKEEHGNFTKLSERLTEIRNRQF